MLYTASRGTNGLFINKKLVLEKSREKISRLFILSASVAYILYELRIALRGGNGEEMNEKRKGLTEEEVIASREKYGDNSLERAKNKSILKRFFENLSDPIIKILIGALCANVIFNFTKINFT